MKRSYNNVNNNNNNSPLFMTHRHFDYYNIQKINTII